VTEIYLDVETQRLSSEVPGGWNNIRAFGVSVAVTWDEPAGFRDWYEADVARLRTGLPVRITLDAFRGRSFKNVSIRFRCVFPMCANDDVLGCSRRMRPLVFSLVPRSQE